MKRFAMSVRMLFLALSVIACADSSKPEAATETTTAVVAEPAPDLGIRLPEGFEIRVFAEDVPNARAMCVGDDGTIYVGSRSKGGVHAVVDRDGDFKADAVYAIDKGLNMPTGVAFRDGSLYVAEVNRILQYDNIGSKLENPPDPVVVNDDFPSDRHHGWKYLGFGPDGWLYVPVGAPCNICLREDNPQYASIMRLRPDGSDLQVYASGARNSVGFDWHPETGALWFTENGRDMLGDDIPPDELNCAPEQGMHFGYPFCHAGTIADPEFGDQHPCSDFTAPAQALGPHVAAIGMTFYTGSQFPAEYKNRIFIAEHGSWNRSKKIGYRITMVTPDGNKGSNYQPFAEGWLLDNEDVTGRPADVLQLSDGSLLVSDDYADKIYRISYRS